MKPDENCDRSHPRPVADCDRRPPELTPDAPPPFQNGPHSALGGIRYGAPGRPMQTYLRCSQILNKKHPTREGWDDADICIIVRARRAPLDAG